jgi:hypothetical protein
MSSSVKKLSSLVIVLFTFNLMISQ